MDPARHLRRQRDLSGARPDADLERAVLTGSPLRDVARMASRPKEHKMMKLYVTYTSPFARLARIVVAEKKLERRVEVVEARTRTADSPYYRINPSGRVPYLIDDSGVGMEDSQLICAYLDHLAGIMHGRLA